MKKLNIIRLGSAHGSPGRYIDVAESDEVASVTWLAKRGDKMVEKIFDYGRTHSSEFTKKFKVLYFAESFRFKMISSLVRRSNRLSILARLSYYPILILSRFMYLPEISETLRDNEIDFVWAGNNDSDGITQILLCYAHQLNVPCIFAYQEHRCCYRMDEAISFKYSNMLVFSSQRNIDFFSKTYGEEIAKKSIVANEDWRPSCLINKVYDAKIGKLSSADKVPRILILARFVTYGSKANKRRGSRVNYLEIIEELLTCGAIVHLNCLDIVECLDSKICISNNPYEKIKNKYPDRFFIDKPYDMEDLLTYLDMKKFDAGVLHNYVNGEQVSKFSKMNTPNRFFEYLVAGVKPIVLKNTLLDVEEIINELEFGIVAESYSEAVKKLKFSIESDDIQSPVKNRGLNFSAYFKVLSSAYSNNF
jgi:hypothetical protein